MLKAGEVYLVPFLFKLKEVPCSCHCGHDTALVIYLRGKEYMIGCKECSSEQDLCRVMEAVLMKEGKGKL